MITIPLCTWSEGLSCLQCLEPSNIPIWKRIGRLCTMHACAGRTISRLFFMPLLITSASLIGPPWPGSALLRLAWGQQRILFVKPCSFGMFAGLWGQCNICTCTANQSKNQDMPTAQQLEETKAYPCHNPAYSPASVDCQRDKQHCLNIDGM